MAKNKTKKEKTPVEPAEQEEARSTPTEQPETGEAPAEEGSPSEQERGVDQQGSVAPEIGQDVEDHASQPAEDAPTETNEPGGDKGSNDQEKDTTLATEESASADVEKASVNSEPVDQESASEQNPPSDPEDKEESQEKPVQEREEPTLSEREAELLVQVASLENQLQAAESRSEASDSALRESTASADAAGAKVRELEAELQAHRRTLDGVKQLLAGQSPAAAPAELPLDVAGLAAEAWQQERSSLDEDQKELAGTVSRSEVWSARTVSLRAAIETSVTAATAVLAACAKAEEGLPSEVRDELHGRQEGLNLTGKMLSRLPGRLPQEVDIVAEDLPTVGEKGWHDLLSGERKEESARRRIRQETDRIGSERYQVVSRVRSSGEKAQKSALGFVEKHVLPVLDAIDDGESHSSPLIAELSEKHSEEKDRLGAWCKTYGDLRSLLLSALAEAGVQPMDVEIGTHVDYDRHEPFDVEPDPDLADESIKSVVRRGYEYESGNGQPSVLRPAQVVAVKNVAAAPVVGKVETTENTSADNEPDETTVSEGE